MQEMTPEICSETTTPDIRYANVPEATLIDSRDGKSYIVRKLADGQCWMSQNLDLDLDSTKTYTSADTDIGYGTYGYVGSGTAPDRVGTTSGRTSWTPTNSTQATSDTSVTWNGDGATDHSYDPGNIWFTDGYIMTSTKGTNDATRHIGNYYNFAAYTAGSGASDTVVDYELMPDSICPKGWRLPQYDFNSGRKAGSFEYLFYNSYGGIPASNYISDALQPPFSFNKTGFFTGSAISIPAESSTAHRSRTGYLALMNAGSPYVYGHGGSYSGSGYVRGINVRCVAR